MLTEFNEHIKENLPFLWNGHLLVAVSGGLDSVVLVHLLKQLKLKFSIAHCNFKLRGKESDEDEKFVKSLALKIGIKFYSKSFKTSIKKHSTQMAARELRYKWFDELLLKEKMKYVLTAHHLDDSIETFFINLTRSTGIQGLVGLKNINENTIRPMLIFSKSQIFSFASKNKIEWREDSSNKSSDYVRNKIRNEIIPVFKQINPDFTNAFRKTKDFLNDANYIINEHTKKIKSETLFRDKNGNILFPKNFLIENQSTLHYIFKDFGFNDKNQIIDLCNATTGKMIESKSHQILSNRSNLIVQEKIDNPECYFEIHESGIDHPINIKFEKGDFNSKATKTCFYLNRIDIEFPLILRKFKKGDVFYPNGMEGKKLISKYYKDEKMSKFDKEQQWLLCNKNEIMWIVGRRTDRRYSKTNKSNMKIEVS